MLPSCGTKKAFITLAEVSAKCIGIAGGDDQLVDARDALSGIDEQPLPVERHDLDLERRRRFDGSGLAGSRSCDPIQATPPRSMIVSSGIAQTISSMRPEYAQSGR